MGKRGPKKGAPDAGRPPLPEIDWKTFEAWVRIGCTEMEIACHLDMDRNTLEDRVKEHYGKTFSSVYEQFYEQGNMSLRRLLHNMAYGDKNTKIVLRMAEKRLGMAAESKVEYKGDAPAQTIRIEVVRPGDERKAT